jgi:hypothetical protein
MTPSRRTEATGSGQSGRTKEDIDGRAAKIFRLVLVEAQAQIAREFEMKVAAGNVDDPSFGTGVGGGFADAEGA